jgi:hypothetical protein
MSNVQQLHDRLSVLENETSDQFEARKKVNDAAKGKAEKSAARKAKAAAEAAKEDEE